MRLVTLYCAMVRVYTGELYIFAQIVTAVLAKETFAAGYARFDSYAVTYIIALVPVGFSRSKFFTRFQGLYPLSTLQDDTSCFMTQDTVAFNDKRAYPACPPKVNVRSGNVNKVLYGFNVLLLHTHKHLSP